MSLVINLEAFRMWIERWATPIMASAAICAVAVATWQAIVSRQMLDEARKANRELLEATQKHNKLSVRPLLQFSRVI